MDVWVISTCFDYYEWCFCEQSQASLCVDMFSFLLGRFLKVELLGLQSNLSLCSCHIFLLLSIRSLWAARGLIGSLSHLNIPLRPNSGFYLWWLLINNTRTGGRERGWAETRKISWVRGESRETAVDSLLTRKLGFVLCVRKKACLHSTRTFSSKLSVVLFLLHFERFLV